MVTRRSQTSFEEVLVGKTVGCFGIQHRLKGFAANYVLEGDSRFGRFASSLGEAKCSFAVAYRSSL